MIFKAINNNDAKVIILFILLQALLAFIVFDNNSKMTATDVEDRLKNTLPEYAMPQVRIYYVENVDDAHDINCGVLKFLIYIHYDL